jgi:hypothetical protein
VPNRHPSIKNREERKERTVTQRPSLEAHQQHSSRSTMSLKFLLASLVAAASAQDATPTWFLKTGLTGTFSERSEACKAIFKEGGNEARSASDGPIFVPEGTPADICIRFPATETLKGGWRHDKGEQGACSDGCCEFLPPVSNLDELRTKPQPTWFEFSGDCSNTGAAKAAPILFKGKFEESKTICFKKEDGSFVRQNGQLGNCGGSCCIFYGDQQ